MKQFKTLAKPLRVPGSLASFLATVLLSGVALAGTAYSGAKLEIEIDDKLAKTKHTARLTSTDDGLRMEGGGQGATEPYGFIVFHKTGRLVMLSHNEKKYMEFRKDGVLAQYNQNKAKIAQQYEKAFEKMPADKREMMKNMLPGFKPKAKIKYVKGKAGKVSGFPCTNYKKYKNDRLTDEYCFTKGKDFQPVLDAVKKSEKIWNTIHPDDNNDFFNSDYGIPLKTVTYDKLGKIAEIQTVKKYEPKVVFKKSPIAIPAGYTKQNLDRKATPDK